jgi:hypothetical protein
MRSMPRRSISRRPSRQKQDARADPDVHSGCHSHSLDVLLDPAQSFRDTGGYAVADGGFSLSVYRVNRLCGVAPNSEDLSPGLFGTFQMIAITNGWTSSRSSSGLPAYLGMKMTSTSVERMSGGDLDFLQSSILWSTGFRHGPPREPPRH